MKHDSARVIKDRANSATHCRGPLHGSPLALTLPNFPCPRRLPISKSFRVQPRPLCLPLAPPAPLAPLARPLAVLPCNYCHHWLLAVGCKAKRSSAYLRVRRASRKPPKMFYSIIFYPEVISNVISNGGSRIFNAPPIRPCLMAGLSPEHGCTKNRTAEFAAKRRASPSNVKAASEWQDRSSLSAP